MGRDTVVEWLGGRVIGGGGYIASPHPLNAQQEELLAVGPHGSGRRPAIFGSGRRRHLYSCPVIPQGDSGNGRGWEEAEHEG